jgi:subtilase family serine protease
MSQVIVFTNSSGGVSVCYSTGEIPIEEVQAKNTPAGSIIVENDALPNEHNEFFNAWELSGSTVSVNMGKAKAITKTRLRMEREPLLAAQDVAFQRAMESNADTTAIVAEKQRLRDITQLADAADSLNALKALHP